MTPLLSPCVRSCSVLVGSGINDCVHWSARLITGLCLSRRILTGDLLDALIGIDFVGAFALVQCKQGGADGCQRGAGIFFGAGKVRDGLSDLASRSLKYCASFSMLVENDVRNDCTVFPMLWAALSVVQ